MRFIKTIFIALALMAGNLGFAQVPERPANASPIVDMAGIIKNDSLVNALNAQLDTLFKQTKNQIVVVTVDDMGGQDAVMFASELGRKWGVGDKELNNGVVIVVKPRNDKGPGEIGIAPGYGLEGVMPDVWVKHLQNESIVPLFKKEDYAGGIKAAIDKMVPLLIKEHNRIQNNNKNSDTKKKGDNGWLILAVIAGVIALLVLLGRRRKKNQPSTHAQPQASRLAGEENVQPDEEPEENPEEEEPEEPEEEDDTPDPNAPKPYKYNYGGGDFGGGGASTKF